MPDFTLNPFSFKKDQLFIDSRAVSQESRSSNASSARSKKPGAETLPFNIEKDPRKSGKYYISFNKNIANGDAEKIVFKNGIIPAEVLFIREVGIFPKNTWSIQIDQRRIKHLDIDKNLQVFTPEVSTALLNLSEHLHLDTNEAEAYHQRYYKFANQKVPFDKSLTVSQVLEKYQDGVYEKNGYTFYIGYDEAYPQAVRILDVIRDSDFSETIFSKGYLNDIKYYLKMGYPLSQAKELTFQLWVELNKQIGLAFADTLANAPSMGAPGMLKNKPMKPTSTKALVIEAASTATNLIMNNLDSVLNIVHQIVKKIDLQLDQGGFAEDVYIDIKSIASIDNTYARFLPSNGVLKNKGDIGEIIIKKILEDRGYTTYSFQNGSGHGVDILAVKVIQENGKTFIRIMPIEVKTSNVGKFTLSQAQKDMVNFVKSRMERAQFYPNLSKTECMILKDLVNQVNSGAARISSGAKAFVHLDFDVGNINIKFSKWGATTGIPISPRFPHR
jgi:hypothetical protein